MLQQRNAVEAGDRLDAPQVRTDAALAHDLDRADVTRGLHVRAAAELDRAARFEDPDDVAVFVAEEGDRAERRGLLLRGLVDAGWSVLQDLAVGDGLDLGDLVIGERGVVAEVEAQTIRTDQRSGLLDVRAEHRPQGVVQHVGTRVVAPDGVAARDIDVRGSGLSRRDGALRDARGVPPQTRQGVRGVHDFRASGVRGDGAGITHLATRLGVERRAIQEDFDQRRAVGGGGVQRHHGEYAALRLVLHVAEELGDAELLVDLAVGLVLVFATAVRLATLLGHLALLGHVDVEAGAIDADAALAGNLLRQLQREAIRVVQAERRAAVERGNTGRELVLEDGEAGLQGLAEALLLLGEHAHDEVAVLDDVRVRVPHDLDRRLHQAGHDQLLGTEQVGVADGPADDAPQHIATPLIAREHSVVHQHRAAAGVFGQHAQAEAVAIVVVARDVELSGGRRGLIDQRLHHVGFPDTVLALHEGEDALEPGTRVDGRLRQRRAGAVRGLVELHEDQVPELHEPVALRIVQWAPFGTERRPAIDVQLAARTAGACVAHLPEVVLVAEALDAVHRYADDVVPDLLRFVVALMHGDPDLVAVKTEGLGDQLPAPRNRVRLEVVPEAEVAHHLEEHEVALGAADIVEIVVLAAGTRTLLDRDRALERRCLVPDEVRLERHHAGNAEQHGGVVRDEARRCHCRVPALDEEVGIRVA